jgi:hypothetical protein
MNPNPYIVTVTCQDCGLPFRCLAGSIAWQEKICNGCSERRILNGLPMPGYSRTTGEPGK